MRQLINLIEFKIHISTEVGMVFKIAFDITYRPRTFVHHIPNHKLKCLIFVQSNRSKCKKRAFECFDCFIKTLPIKVSPKSFKLRNQYIYCDEIKERVYYTACKITKGPPVFLTSRKPIIKLPEIHPPKPLQGRQQKKITAYNSWTD